MLSGREAGMKLTKLQRKILIILLLLCLLTPAGVLLPAFFNAGDAWGEWSAQTVKDLVGYVPAGLAGYSGKRNAPVEDYSFGTGSQSLSRRSGYYLVSGLFGATLVYIITLLITRLIVRKNE